LLSKPVLDVKIFSFNPTKLAQLLLEGVHEHRAARSSAWIQKTYAEDFCCLLRLGMWAKYKEHGAKRVGKSKFQFFTVA
jgi:hypothetical protein